MHDRSSTQYGFGTPSAEVWRRGLGVCAIVVLASSSVALVAQNLGAGAPPPSAGLRTDRADLPTPLNELPDPNAQMRLRQKRANQQNFDAANALRQHQIDDESTKLLILARDLKIQMEKLGARPLTPRLMREVELIEIFARDVQQKMVLTAGPG
jgi:hypothetical protein